jgi:hypothetical protein
MSANLFKDNELQAAKIRKQQLPFPVFQNACLYRFTDPAAMTAPQTACPRPGNSF